MSDRVLREKGLPFPRNEMLRISLVFPFIRGALTQSLPQRGRVSPTMATGEGERDGTAMWDRKSTRLNSSHD